MKYKPCDYDYDDNGHYWIDYQGVTICGNCDGVRDDLLIDNGPTRYGDPCKHHPVTGCFSPCTFDVPHTMDDSLAGCNHRNGPRDDRP
jgi:5'(3')-deoxyribonucleotidase